MTFTRKSTWETDLHEYLASMAFAEHVYGKTDCALFAASAVEAMTGVDPAAEYRGKYNTELGAAKALRQIGGGTLETAFDAKFDIIAPAFAQRGDLIFDGANVGVCSGAFAFFMGAHDDKGTGIVTPGLVRVPRAEFVKAWRVG